MANSVPTLAGLDSPTMFLENTVNAAPQLIDADVTLSDPDGNLAGGTLTVTGLLPEDIVSIRNQGTGPGQIGFFAGVVTYQGILIGQAFGGAGGTFAVTLNANATTAAVEALIENITYANTSDVPTASRTLTINVTDGAGVAAEAPLVFEERAGAASPFGATDVGSMSAPNFGDLDADGDLDMVVGRSDGLLSYFENTGSAAAPVFTPRAGAANPFDAIPDDQLSLIDLDDDGDLDGVLSAGGLSSSLRYLENIGTAASPSFVLRTGTANPLDGLGGTAAPFGGAAPAFGDIDGDGDLDLVIGASDVRASFFENIGTAASPSFVRRIGTDNPFAFGEFDDSVPTLADVDRDGDLDLAVGFEFGGQPNYWENTGTASAPVFTFEGNLIGGAIGFGLNIHPAFADLDGDGDVDLVFGERDGTINYFENTSRLALTVAVNVAPENDASVKTFDFALVDADISYAGNTVIINGPSSHTAVTGVSTYIFTDGTVNENDGDRLVADLFYYSQNHDVWSAHIDADQHYHQTGWQQGLDPSVFFDASLYLSANPGVKAAGIDPLTFFDQTGWKAGHTPSLTFDPAQYLAANPDVAAAGVDPLWHFLAVGASEGRLPFAPTELLGPGGFDFVHYLTNNPDVAAAGVDPIWHFQVIGWKEGRDPNAHFDTSGYLSTYTDVAAAQINPFDHYNIVGWMEGRDPSVGFDTTAYLAAYPDVAAANINPLLHFLFAGNHEGRSPQGDGIWG